VQQTFVLHTQNSVTFVMRTKKAGPKKLAKRQQKRRQERRQKRWQKTRQKSTLSYTHMLIIKNKKLLKAFS